MDSFDVNNYTTDELMELANVTELDPDEIATQTGKLITKFRLKQNSEMADFFQQVQDKLFLELENSHNLVDREKKVIPSST